MRKRKPMNNGCLRVGGQKGGPVLALRVEASFCLDFFGYFLWQ
jgi:hypothetical protein